MSVLELRQLLDHALDVCGSNEKDLIVVKDMDSYFMRKLSLSDPQQSFLRSIIKRNENTPVDEAWAKEYRESLRPQFQQAVEYYSHPSFDQYYQGTRLKFHMEPEWVPSRELFDKMVNNKYIAAYRKALLLPPKLQHGEMVQRKRYDEGDIWIVVDIQPPHQERPSYGHIYQIKNLTTGMVRPYTYSDLKRIKEKK